MSIYTDPFLCPTKDLICKSTVLSLGGAMAMSIELFNLFSGGCLNKQCINKLNKQLIINKQCLQDGTIVTMRDIKTYTYTYNNYTH